MEEQELRTQRSKKSDKHGRHRLSGRPRPSHEEHQRVFGSKTHHHNVQPSEPVVTQMVSANFKNAAAKVEQRRADNSEHEKWKPSSNIRQSTTKSRSSETVWLGKTISTILTLSDPLMMRDNRKRDTTGKANVSPHEDNYLRKNAALQMVIKATDLYDLSNTRRGLAWLRSRV